MAFDGENKQDNLFGDGNSQVARGKGADADGELTAYYEGTVREHGSSGSPAGEGAGSLEFPVGEVVAADGDGADPTWGASVHASAADLFGEAADAGIGSAERGAAEDGLPYAAYDSEIAAAPAGDGDAAPDSDGPSAPGGPLDLSAVRVRMPALRQKRNKADLMPDAKPALEPEGGADAPDLREHRDYELAYLPDDDGQPDWSQGALRSITETGTYWVVVRGTSECLKGTAEKRFEVAAPRKRWPWAVLAAIIAAVAIGAALYFSGLTPWYDPNADEGIAGLDGEDLQAYLDAKVEEGSMNITVVTPVVFNDGTTNADEPGQIAFNNLAANHVDQKLTVTLDDTGEVVCETGAISPGQNIQYITLNRELSPGMYDATATVTGYDRDTHAEKGALAAKIQIVVKDPQAG